MVYLSINGGKHRKKSLTVMKSLNFSINGAQHQKKSLTVFCSVNGVNGL